MASGYTRQSSAEIVTGQVIEASDFNNEFAQILAAFNASTGHDHSGGTGLAPPISLTLTATGVTGVLHAKFGGVHTAAADPTTTDDTPDYAVGSIWINTTSKDLFQCMDNTSTAAVWVKRNAHVTGSAPTVNSDIDQGYIKGSVWCNTALTPSVLYVCIDNTNGAAIWYPIGRGRIGVITGATTPPSVTEDSAAGYSQGSLIINSTQSIAYICISASAGAAVWQPIGKGKVGTGSSAPGVGDDANDGYGISVLRKKL